MEKKATVSPIGREWEPRETNMGSCSLTDSKSHVLRKLKPKCFLLCPRPTFKASAKYPLHIII